MNRRGFLKALSVAPVAAPMAAREIARTAGATALGGVGGLNSISHGAPVAGTDWITECAKRAGLPRAVWMALNRSFDKRREEIARRSNYRNGGIYEHDLMACGSWSPSFLASVQCARDKALLDEINGDRLRLWPRDDE